MENNLKKRYKSINFDNFNLSKKNFKTKLYFQKRLKLRNNISQNNWKNVNKNSSVVKFNIENYKIFESNIFPKIINFNKQNQNLKNTTNEFLIKSNKKKIIFTKIKKRKLRILNNNNNNNNKDNKYFKLNMSIFDIKSFLRDIKKEKNILEEINYKNENIIKKDVFFDNEEIFPSRIDKIILFEIKGLIIDKINNKVIYRNEIKKLIKKKFNNIIFGIYSELSYSKIKWFINNIDPKKNFFKWLIDRNYLIKYKSTYYKSLKKMNLSSINPNNIILIDKAYKIDNSIKNIIVFPEIKNIDNKNDNLHLILSEFFEEIENLKDEKINKYLNNKFLIN